MTHRTTPFSIPIAATIVALTMTTAARAVFDAPAWHRPSTAAEASILKTTYQNFSIFDDDDLSIVGVQDESPDVSANPNGDASVTEAGNGFVTSTGHIYSPYAVLDMHVNVPGYAPTAGASTKFLVQFETQGSELVRTNPDPPTYDFSAFKINGTSVTSLRGFQYTELSRDSRDDGQGNNVQHAFSFTLPTTATSYQFAYKPLGTSCSQAYISVDTFVAVPGDFNYDGVRDSKDIDLLLRAASGSTLGKTPTADSLFDVNLDDNVITTIGAAGSDSDAWVQTLAHTRYGDANLDGKVNFNDLVILAQSYGKSIGLWAQGDFNGSGKVDFNDLILLAQNYNFGTAGATLGSRFASDWTLAQSLVPEPTLLLSLAAVGAMATLRRKQQR